MRYLSLFSGIEAASVAWLPLGWTCVGVAEIDPFPCAVLAHHYPDVPNLGSVVDITDAQIAALGPIDIVVGGSPCQDLSVAGKRAGLAGERSGLFHQQLRIFHAARHFCGARFLLWENVPGAFSSNRGLDFAVVAGAMAGCRLPVPEIGWGTEGVALGEHGLLEWAVLDAGRFGLPMRRRRLFGLLDAGDWCSRRPVLLDRAATRQCECPLPWIPSIDASGLAKRQTMPERGRCWTVHDGFGHRFLTPEEVEVCLGFPPGYSDVRSLQKGQADRRNGEAGVASEWSAFMVPRVHQQQKSRDEKQARNEAAGFRLELADSVRTDDAGARQDVVRSGRVVRHMFRTPAPDGRGSRSLDRVGAGDSLPSVQHQAAQHRPMAALCSGAQISAPLTPDGPRYKALGNSMAVPVMRWIGKRIAMAVPDWMRGE